ncbi:MAG: hypothetical protein AAB511_02335 [Patescibacteria group bacterium]
MAARRLFIRMADNNQRVGVAEEVAMEIVRRRITVANREQLRNIENGHWPSSPSSSPAVAAMATQTS